MEPATIAIIPLVLFAVVIYVVWFKVWNELSTFDRSESYAGAGLSTLFTSVVFGILWMLGNVVYHNSWSF